MEEIRKTDRNNLIEGPILKNLILFFIPVALGTLFQQLYNAVDAFVVSKYVGTVALAAVGGSPAIVSNLVIGFCNSLSAGCAVKIAQFYGAKEDDKVKDSIKTSFIFCFVLGILIGHIIIEYSAPILRLLNTTEEAFELSLTYQRIYFIGALPLLIYNMGSGILRSLGNSKYPFVSLFIGCGLNIILDFVFVKYLNLGVSGVAYATIISETVSAVLILVKLIFNKTEYKLNLIKYKFDFNILKQMLKIGVPSGFQSSMYGFSNVILQIAVNSLGTIVVASWAMSGKVDGVFWATTSAFGIAVTAFIGQNYGAKNYKRIKECAKKAFIFFFLLTIAISGTLIILSKPILNILSDDVDVIKTTYFIILMFVPFYFLWSVIEVYTSVLRGIGDTVIPSIIQLIGICILRIIWVYTIFKWFNTLTILCICYSVSWLFTDIFIYIYYRIAKKKKLDIENENSIPSGE